MKRITFILTTIILLATISSCSSDDDSIGSSTKRCIAKTKDGTQCKRNADKGSSYCWQHK